MSFIRESNNYNNHNNNDNKTNKSNTNNNNKIENNNIIINNNNNNQITINNDCMMMTMTNMNEVQEKYLREATLFFRGIEKPLKYGPTVNSLQDLINGLYKAFETKYVNIELVNHLMLSYKSNPKEWQKFAKWDRYRYTRNLVDEGNGKFNLMILCWGEGHASAIHDHSDSHCFMKIVQGELVETKYKLPSSFKSISKTSTSSSSATAIQENDIGICEKNICSSNNHNDDHDNNYDGCELKKMSRHILELNAVCYINDNIGLHRVENPSHTDGAVSLHLYCPPFNSCSIFQKKSGQRVKCPVTFWSKYGVRQVMDKESEAK